PLSVCVSSSSVAVAAPTAVVAASGPVSHIPAATRDVSSANVQASADDRSDPPQANAIKVPAVAEAATASAPARSANGVAAPQSSSLEEIVRAAGMQMIETRADAPAPAPEPVERLGRARKAVTVTDSEPLQQVETRS